MYSITYARLTLLLPYLTLIESVGYFKFFNPPVQAHAALHTFNIIWNFFAVFWIIPYSILVIYLLIWSKRKTIEQVKSTYAFAPFIMMLVSLVTYIAILIIGSVFDQDFYKGTGGLLIIAAVVSIPASIVIGYCLVGISFISYVFFQKIKLIQD